MSTLTYQFKFADDVPIEEVESTLLLTGLAIEGVYGPVAMHLESGFIFNRPKKIVFIDGTTTVGQALCRVLFNFLVREFGEGAFDVSKSTAFSHQEVTKCQIASPHNN